MTQRPGISLWGLILVIGVVAAGCGRSIDTTKLTELQRVKSGTLDVVLLSDRDALRHGIDTFIIEFRSTSDGKLVDVGNVRGSVNMPMPGTAMFGNVEANRTAVAGRYKANGEFKMAGTWRMSIRWEGAAGQGSVMFAATVQ